MGKYELNDNDYNGETKRVAELFSALKTDWYLFFNDIGLLIKEYSQTSTNLTKDKRVVFFKFLEEVFATDATKNLKEDEKEHLFVLTQQELTDYSYDLNNIDDLKMLYDRFNVFLRVKHKNWSPAVLDLIGRYANKVARANIVLDKKNNDINWHFTNFFWILNVNFTHYVNNTIAYEDFKKTFNMLKNMNGEIRRWDANSIFSFRTVLGTYRIVRQNLKNNAKVCEDLDKASQNFISNIIELTKYQCFSLTLEEVKEAAYIEYVKNLSSSKKLFSNLYKTVDKIQVFSSQYTFSPPNKAFKMTIAFQQLKKSERNIINKAILETYHRMEALRKRLGNISYKQPIEDQVFRLHIFNSKEQYVKYGPLWGINTAGGGYAHVRNSLEDDQSMINRPLLKNEKWYETFVYQQNGDARNRPTKEGGNFRNLGHEVQHTFFYALMGPQGLHHLPSWMIEGAANALGNEQCFKEEADYIKNYQDRLPKIERIINMSYSSGSDLYYFGSALFRFMLARQPDLLKLVLNQAQQQKPTQEINSSIKNGLRDLEADFNNWLIQIETCSKVEKNELIKKIINDEQQQYQLDLAKNQNLKDFLQNMPTKFVFQDTIFHLTSEHITRSSRTYYPSIKIFLERPQPLTLQDYNWFKSALEIYVIEIKLNKFNLISGPDNLIQSLVSHQDDQFIIRKIMKMTNERDINLTSEQILQLNPALETFVFKSVDLSPNLKKRFDALNQQQKSDPLITILKKQIRSNSVCEIYLKNDHSRKDSSMEILSDEPFQPLKMQVSPMLDETIKNIYHKRLRQSKALRSLVKNNGEVHFIFKDTIFVLTSDNLNRYDLNENLQPLSAGDFEWLESALEILFIRNFFSKKGLDLNEENIAELLNVNSEYVTNRQLTRTVPSENACLRLMVQEFVLSSNLSNALKYRLMQFGYDIHHPFEIPSVDNMNATSVLGALMLMASNASLILNSLIPTSRQLTQRGDESCDANDFLSNNFYWFLTGGVLVTAGIILLLGFFLGCKINKAKEIHPVKEQAKTSSSDSELDKFESLKEALTVLECSIEKNLKKDNAKFSCQRIAIIINNLDYLINLVKKGFDPAAIHSHTSKKYLLYQERFDEIVNNLVHLQANFSKFRKAVLIDQVNKILARIRALRALPRVPNSLADHKETHVSMEEQDIGQNNKVTRYTPEPLSTFKNISWFFNGKPDNLSPLVPESQAMIALNDQQDGGEELIYANVRIYKKPFLNKEKSDKLPPLFLSKLQSGARSGTNP